MEANAPIGKPQRFERGTVLIHENEVSRRMFVIRTGKVRVYKTYVGQKITLAVLGEGEIFGEMSFFDAKPRSATVEALTPVEVFVIDSEEANRQFQGLPEWFQPIIKTVLDRLRNADMRTTMLQSMNEVEKRHFKKDSVAEGLYRELARFNRLLVMVADNLASGGKKVRSAELLEKLDEVLGDRTISLQSYWKLLKEFGFLDRDLEETQGLVKLHRENVDSWIADLASELESGKCTLLSHSAVAVLKRVVSFLKSDDTAVPDSPDVKFTIADVDIASLPLAADALTELLRVGIIRKGDEHSFAVRPSVIFKVYTQQSLLKYFDHSIHQGG